MEDPWFVWSQLYIDQLVLGDPLVRVSYEKYCNLKTEAAFVVYRFLFDMSMRDGCTYTGHVGENCVHVLL